MARKSRSDATAQLPGTTLPEERPEVAGTVEKPSVPTLPVTIYTDGACDPNPGTGGWAAVLIYKGHAKELSGGELNTTNNRMEMMAAIKALESLKKPCAVKMHTDSEYLKKGITEWLPGWKRRGWRRKTGAVKNSDLWKRLDELTRSHHVDWRWVRGHAGDGLNERCDLLACEAREKLTAAAGRKEAAPGKG